MPLRATFFLALAIWGLGAPAQAYIDPTAAGIALQSAYVVAASALVTLATFPRKVAEFAQRLKGKLLPGRVPGPTDE